MPIPSGATQTIERGSSRLSNYYKLLFLLLFLVVLVSKALVAGRLDLAGDEAFYWQCGQRPSLHYVNLPPVTALLTRLGSEIFGNSPFGVRLPFLFFGAVFPFAMYLLAKPLLGARDAWLAAGSTLVVPGTAHFGLMAIPDVPLLVWIAVFLLCFERATRTGSMALWILAGAAAALGFATHYRFVLAAVAVGLYLTLTSSGRSHLRQRGLWVGSSVAAVGLIPALLHNLRTHNYPIRYYLLGRHGSEIHLGGLGRHLGEQAVLVTPLMYAALIAVLVTLFKRASRGDDRAALLATFSSTHLGVFLVASVLHNVDMTTAHWPVPGYIPLLAVLPSALCRFVRARPTLVRKLLVVLTPGLGVLVMAIILLELGTGWPRLPSPVRPFAGWSETATELQVYFPELSNEVERRPIVVADNYKLGANLEFQLGSAADVYVLNHPKNRQHGRAPQFDIWRIGEEALGRRGGEDALVVVQRKLAPRAQRDEWLSHVESLFGSLESLSELRVDAGPGEAPKVFLFFRGRGIRRRAVDVHLPQSLQKQRKSALQAVIGLSRTTYGPWGGTILPDGGAGPGGVISAIIERQSGWPVAHLRSPKPHHEMLGGSHEPPPI